MVKTCTFDRLPVATQRPEPLTTHCFCCTTCCRICFWRLAVAHPQPLPSKKIVGNMSPEFVEERRLQLQTFLNGVVFHLKLSRSFDLTSFLSASTDGLEAAKALCEPDKPGMVQSVSGWFKSGAWFKSNRPHPALAELQASDNFREVRQRMDAYEGHLKKLTALCEKVVKVNRGTCAVSGRPWLTRGSTRGLQYWSCPLPFRH